MKKPISRYILAVLVCLIIWGICIALMVVTGIGGVIAMLIMCFTIKYIWRAIIDYDDTKDTDNSFNDAKNTDELTSDYPLSDIENDSSTIANE